MYIKCKIITVNMEVLETLDKINNFCINLHSYLKTYFVIKDPQLSRKVITSVIK